MFGVLLKIVRIVAMLLAGIVLLLLTVWAAGALYFDFQIVSLRTAAAIGYVAVIFVLIRALDGYWRKVAGILICFLVILLCWLTFLRPSNERPWQKDVAELASVDIQGDNVTLRNVRNFDYQTETDYTPRWETRTVRLSELRGIDMFINYWGSPWMAHPIISFDFGGPNHIAFSIETRKEMGEAYSAIGGFYRQYELIYLIGDERDLVRVRTNYRKGEDVYLYRSTLSPEKCRERFLEYVEMVNQLKKKPIWYNAATTNCTTSIRAQHSGDKRAPWDWRMLINGKMDELLYERGAFVTEGLSFEDLKKRAHVNPAAKGADKAPDFSQRIRAGRPGFSKQ